MESFAVFSHQSVELNHFHAERIIEVCLNEAKQITLLTIPLIEEAGMQGSMNVTAYLGSFFDLSRLSAIPYLTRKLIPKFKGKSHEDRDAEGFLIDFISINELLWKFYRDLGKEAGATESFMLFYIHQAIEENVKTILDLLNDKGWLYKRKELESLVSCYLSFFWVAFEAHKRITKNIYLDMIDFLGWLGLVSAKGKWLQITDSCIQDISSIAKDYIDKGEAFHFEAPRIFMKNVYILMVAGKDPFCAKIRKLVMDEMSMFQTSYVSKLNGADSSGRFCEEFKTRLLIELGQLRKDFQESEGNLRILREAQDFLFREVEESDFDAVEVIIREIVDPPKASAI
jgi:hypothetical protein